MRAIFLFSEAGMLMRAPGGPDDRSCTAKSVPLLGGQVYRLNHMTIDFLGCRDEAIFPPDRIRGKVAPNGIYFMFNSND